MKKLLQLVDGPYGVLAYDSCAVAPWWVYAAASGGFALLTVALAALLALWEWAHSAAAAARAAAGREGRRERPNCAWETRVALERACEQVKSGAGPLGWLFNAALVVFTAGNWILFLVSNLEVTYEAGGVDLHSRCGRSWYLIGDFVTNAGFAFFFLVRFVAARRKLTYCVFLTTLADLWIIPSAMVAFAYAADWTGLRFLGVLRLLYVPDALLYMGVLRNYAAIRFTQIAVNVGTIFMHDAGWMALFENLGDFWNANYVNPCSIHPPASPGCGPYNAMRTYIDYVFFIIPATFTGFGSLSPTPISALGKFFLCTHLVLTFWYMATALVELFQYFSAPSVKYSSNVQRGRRDRHVILSGSLSYRNIRTFYKNLWRMRREHSERGLLVFCLSETPPDLRLSAALLQQRTRLRYVLGSACHGEHLERVHVRDAEAVVLMADLYAADAAQQDAATIMRVVALKSYSPSTRCIVQLLEWRSRALVANVPGWSAAAGDRALCVAELKLGFCAQNALAAGFCTLLTNAVTCPIEQPPGLLARPRDALLCRGFAPRPDWQRLYERGADHEIYQVHVPRALDGQSFAAAAEFAYVRLELVLFAVSVLDPRTRQTSALLVNPTDLPLSADLMRAFVLAPRETAALRLAHYCAQCHADARPHAVARCPHYRRVNDRADALVARARAQADGEALATRGPLEFGSVEESCTSSSSASANFHLSPCAPPGASGGDGVLLTPAEARQMHFENHIVLCIVAKKDSPPIGISNFLVPLRLKSIPAGELAPVVIVASKRYMAQELDAIRRFARVWVLGGSPLKRPNLDSVSLARCSSVAVVSARAGAGGGDDDDDGKLFMSDRDAVFCTLLVKSVAKKHLKLAGQLSSVRPPATPGERVSRGRKYGGISESLNLFTELLYSKNAVFLVEEVNQMRSLQLFEGFARGRLFCVSTFDSLLCHAVYSPDTLLLARTLITGGVTDAALEDLLDEGAVSSAADAKAAAARRAHLPHAERFSSFRVRLFSLLDAPLSLCVRERGAARVGRVPVPLAQRADGELPEALTASSYSELFLGALQRFRIVCLGLYRKMDVEDPSLTAKRFVLTSPPGDLLVARSDLVYCFQPARLDDLDVETRRRISVSSSLSAPRA